MTATHLPQLADRLALGATGLRVSPVCLGLTSADVVGPAFDAGINFFFVSADMHWPLYEGARRGLEALLARGAHVRDEVVVAAVSYVARPEFCWAPFHEVVDAVGGLDHLDVSVLGGAGADDSPRRRRELDKHRERGFLGVRAIGSSFHDRAAALAASTAGGLDISFVRYNPRHPGAATDLFPHVTRRAGSLLYSFKSTTGAVSSARLRALGVGDDHWHPEAADYHRFALSQPVLDGVLCSLETPGDVVALDAALRRGPLTADEQAYLVQLARLDRGDVELA